MEVFKWLGSVGKKPQFFYIYKQVVSHKQFTNHVTGDGHLPNSRGLYTRYKDSLRNGIIIPNIS